MKKFKVVFAMSYNVEAEDENDALQLASDLFIEDGANQNLLDVIGSDVEEGD